MLDDGRSRLVSDLKNAESLSQGTAHLREYEKAREALESALSEIKKRRVRSGELYDAALSAARALINHPESLGNRTVLGVLHNLPIDAYGKDEESLAYGKLASAARGICSLSSEILLLADSIDIETIIKNLEKFFYFDANVMLKWVQSCRKEEADRLFTELERMLGMLPDSEERGRIVNATIRRGEKHWIEHLRTRVVVENPSAWIVFADCSTKIEKQERALYLLAELLKIPQFSNFAFLGLIHLGKTGYRADEIAQLLVGSIKENDWNAPDKIELFGILIPELRTGKMWMISTISEITYSKQYNERARKAARKILEENMEKMGMQAWALSRAMLHSVFHIFSRRRILLASVSVRPEGEDERKELLSEARRILKRGGKSSPREALAVR